MSNQLPVINGSLSHPTLWPFPQPRGNRGLRWTAQPHSSLRVPQLPWGLDHTLFPPGSSLSPGVPIPARVDKLIPVSRRPDRCPHNACLALRPSVSHRGSRLALSITNRSGLQGPARPFLCSPHLCRDGPFSSCPALALTASCRPAGSETQPATLAQVSSPLCWAPPFPQPPSHTLCPPISACVRAPVCVMAQLPPRPHPYLGIASHSTQSGSLC